MNKTHPSNSKINSLAEDWIIEELKLGPAKKINFFGSFVDIDGQDKKGFYEVYTRVTRRAGETVPSGCVRKVMKDALKLFLVTKNNKKKGKTLIFVDKNIEKRFAGNSWEAKALQEMGIKLKTVQLPSKIKRLLINSRTRQYR